MTLRVQIIIKDDGVTRQFSTASLAVKPRIRLTSPEKNISIKNRIMSGLWTLIDWSRAGEIYTLLTSPSLPQYVGDKTINGILCTKWMFNITMRKKDNSYVFYASKTVPPKPVRYEMNGYDTLLVSYYDRYVIDYQKFEEWEYDSSKFRISHCKWILSTRSWNRCSSSSE